MAKFYLCAQFDEHGNATGTVASTNIPHHPRQVAYEIPEPPKPEGPNPTVFMEGPPPDDILEHRADFTDPKKPVLSKCPNKARMRRNHGRIMQINALESKIPRALVRHALGHPEAHDELHNIEAALDALHRSLEPDENGNV